MTLRATLALATTLLLACTPDQPTTPPEKWPDFQGVGAGRTAEPARRTDEPAPAIATPVEPAHSGDPLEALTPKPAREGLPGPRSARLGCEGGSRGAGETWKVDCNECSCGADGQVTCTAMACGYR